MTSVRAQIAIFALLGSAATARADETFDAFQTICVSTGAVTADALAVADQLKWMPIPQQLLDNLSQKSLHDAQGRVRSSAAGFAFLFTATGDFGQMGLNGHICAVGIGGGTLPDWKPQAAALAAVPEQTLGGNSVYVWREENGTHIPVHKDDADFKAQAESGTVRFMGVNQTDKITMILFGVLSK